MATINNNPATKRVRFSSEPAEEIRSNNIARAKIPRVKVSVVYNPRLAAIHDARKAFRMLNETTFPLLYTGSFTRKDLEELESGYTKSITNAYSHIEYTIGYPLTPDSVLRIHEICTKHLHPNKPEASGFQFNTLYKPGKPTEAVLNELEEEMTLVPFSKAFTNNLNRKEYLSIYHSQMGIMSTSESAEDAKAHISKRIATYKNDIKKANNINEKLLAIAKFLRALTMFQAFGDGNKRTYLVLLTKLLIEERFSPAFLEDNQLFSKLMLASDMAKRIQEGIERFKKITADS